jgi:glucose/arabinose dehydrogenase
MHAADYRIETWAEGLDLPWSIAFLPEGGALVTELGGTLRPIAKDGTVGASLNGLPPVYFAGQGGLFDVVLHPDFERNSLVYLSFAGGRPDDNGTAVARGIYRDGILSDVEIVFRNFSRKDTAVHYEAAQDLSSGLGKLLRMNDDGSPASGNPFPESPYVYTYGHRNPQGLAVARDGTIWLHEHGPRGGDEVTRIRPGLNYGWPAITHGVDYSGARVSPYTEWEGMEQPDW